MIQSRVFNYKSDKWCPQVKQTAAMKKIHDFLTVLVYLIYLSCLSAVTNPVMMCGICLLLLRGTFRLIGKSSKNQRRCFDWFYNQDCTWLVWFSTLECIEISFSGHCAEAVSS